MKTVAVKDMKTGGFTMCRLTGFGSISSDDRADYTSENKFTEYKNLADGKFGTKVSLGNVQTNLDLKETRIVTLEDDKLVKDSKISALEDDKAVKDTKIANLESDKNDKDNRVAALESDKNEKDTKMSDMESDMALLASQVSLGNVRVSLGNLATRVSSLETLGIKGISGAVSWTNLTEINLSGEKLVNGDFSSVTNNAPTNWTVSNGSLNQTKLAEGIIKGSGGHVSIQQIFPQNIASGTKLIVKVTSNDDIKFIPIKGNGQSDLDNDFTVLGSDGYAEHTTQTIVSGFKVSTVNGLREFSSISIFQGEVSGGTVQVYAGGGLEKISGANGWNAGASSVQKIDGNSDGYVQFQWAKNSLEVGLAYTDDDYAQNIEPYFLRFYSGGRTVASGGYDEASFATVGDWFRVRHYASSNQVHFQKKGTVYVDDADFCLSQTCGLMPNNGHANDHTFATADRPLIKAIETVNGLTAGEYYRIHAVNTNSGNTRIYTTAGVQVGWMTGRGTNWEVQKEAGQDYVTFQTANTLSNGSDLYIDTSFYHVESRINDVTIVT